MSDLVTSLLQSAGLNSGTSSPSSSGGSNSFADDLLKDLDLGSSSTTDIKIPDGAKFGDTFSVGDKQYEVTPPKLSSYMPNMDHPLIDKDSSTPFDLSTNSSTLAVPNDDFQNTIAAGQQEVSDLILNKPIKALGEKLYDSNKDYFDQVNAGIDAENKAGQKNLGEEVLKKAQYGMAGIEGFTGGNIKPTYTEAPNDFLSKAIQATAQGIGMAANIGLMGETLFADFAAPSVLTSALENYPKVATFFNALAQNIPAFVAYGQLNFNQTGAERLQRVATDIVTAIPFTALGLFDSKVATVPVSGMLGYGIAKLSGASDKDALASGVAFSLLTLLGPGHSDPGKDIITHEDARGILQSEAIDTLNAFSEIKLSENPTDKEIDQAFKSAAKNTHPDIGGKTEDFTAVSSARDVLLEKSTPSDATEAPITKEQKMQEDFSMAKQSAGLTPNEAPEAEVPVSPVRPEVVESIRQAREAAGIKANLGEQIPYPKSNIGKETNVPEMKTEKPPEAKQVAPKEEPITATAEVKAPKPIEATEKPVTAQNIAPSVKSINAKPQGGGKPSKTVEKPIPGETKESKLEKARKAMKETEKKFGVRSKKAKFKGFEDVTTKILNKLTDREEVSKQFISDLTNSPDIKQVERDLIREVLKDYPEGKSVPVKEFAEKVKAELLPLNLHNTSTPRYENIVLPKDQRGQIANYEEHIYQSSVKTSAGDVHFHSNDEAKAGYFGHTRIEDLAHESLLDENGEPLDIEDMTPTQRKIVENNKGANTTRRIIEVQSDLYQKGNIDREIKKNSEGLGYEKGVALRGLKKLQQYNNPTAHFRMVREEIKQAAIDGKTKLQFPTGETAMKIEGLGTNTLWVKADDTNARLHPDELKVGKEIVESTRLEDNGEYTGNHWIITDVLSDGKFKAVPKNFYDDYTKTVQGDKTYSKEKAESILKEAIGNRAESFDISGKVNTNDPIFRFYEKELGRYLASKYDAKKITDAQGVSWYEVNVQSEEAGNAVEAFKKAVIKESGQIEKLANDEGIPFNKTTDWARSMAQSFFGDDVDIVFQEGELIDGNAWGQFTPANAWRNPLVKLVTNKGLVQDVTMYHESGHAFLSKFTDPADRAKLIAAIRRNPVFLPQNILTRLNGYTGNDVVAEEIIMDTFAEYAKGKDVPPETKSFFRRMMDTINGWIRKITGMQKFFDRIMAADRSQRQTSARFRDIQKVFDRVDAGVRSKFSKGGYSVGSQKTDSAFDESKDQETIKTAAGEFELGSFGRNSFERKSDIKEDRFPESEIKDTLDHEIKTLKASNDPTSWRSDNIAHVAKMPNGDMRVVYTRTNPAGKEEIVNWHTISDPKYLTKLESFGVPSQNRTGISPLEAGRSDPLTYKDSNNLSSPIKFVNSYSQDVIPTLENPFLTKTNKKDFLTEQKANKEFTKQLSKEEFEKAINNPDIDNLKIMREQLTEAIQNDPVKQLVKYINKRTGELPEVTGGDKGGVFSKKGDDIVKELGFKDSEEARAAIQPYREKQARLKQLNEKIIKLNRAIQDVKDRVKTREILKSNDLFGTQEMTGEMELDQEHREFLYDKYIRPEITDALNHLSDEDMPYEVKEEILDAQDESHLNQILADHEGIYIDDLREAMAKAKIDANARRIDEIIEQGKKDGHNWVRAVVEANRGVVPPEARSGITSPQFDVSKLKDIFLLRLTTDTMERNLEKVATPETAKALQKFLVEPIRKNNTKEAEFNNKVLRTVRDEMKKLGIKKGTKLSDYIQRLGEGKMTITELNERAGDKAENVQRAISFFRDQYNQLIDQWNSERAKFGYKPVPRHANYFRHFKEVSQWGGDFGFLFDPNMLPTEISGLTEYFKPGKSFTSAELQRTGDKTKYDAIMGMENYIKTVSRQIHSMDSIQRGRALERYIRLVAKTNPEVKVPNFVSNLREWTDLLAGKTSIVDRSLERWVDRRILKFGSTLTKRFGSGVIGGNASAAITHAIPLAFNLATVEKGAAIRGLYNTFGSALQSADDFVKVDGIKSDFLVRRFPEHFIMTNGFEKTVQTLGFMFRQVDKFISKLAVSSKYFEGVNNGLSKEEAMAQADNYASRVIGDRSLGNLPVMMSSRTLGFITQFQIEVNDNFRVLIHDIPNFYGRQAYEGGKIREFIKFKDPKTGEEVYQQAPRNWKKIAYYLVSFAIFSHLLNHFYNYLKGSGKGLDPFELGMELFGYNDDNIPFIPQKNGTGATPAENAITSGMDLLKELPFTSILTGGQYPVFQPLQDLITGKSTFKNEIFTILADFGSPVGGGAQLKKTIEGITQFEQGNTETKTGKLKTPIQKTPENFIRGALFGPNAFKESINDNNETSILMQMASKPNSNKQAAEDEYAKMKGMSATDAANAFDALAINDPSLAKSIASIAKDEKMGLSLNERLIKQLNVTDYQRSQYLAQKFNELGTKEEKAALWEDYTAKKIITPEVAKQLGEIFAGKVPEQPTYSSGEKDTNQGVIDTVFTYAKAIGVDPVTAFNRIFTGQRIVRVSNGTVIVQRMSLADSEKIAGEDATVQKVDRKTMRLDHFLPLELGGSNSKDNLKLVPESVWASYTPIEDLLGTALKNGRISKSKAQDLIIKFKNGVLTAEQVRSEVK